MISESLYRSGSAPPTMEGSLSAFGGPVSDELRSDPAYASYYYSNVNMNPRLPPPLLPREEWVGRREGGSRPGGVGFIGEERENGKWGEDGLIGLPGFRVGSRQNLGSVFSQEDIRHTTSVRRHPSLSMSRNSFDHDFVDSGLTRSITPDPQLIGRVSSPRIPPIGRMNSIDKRNVSVGPKLFHYASNGTIDHSSLVTALSNMSISTNGVVNKNESCSSDSHSLDSPNSLCSYGFGGYPINPGSPSMLSSPTSNLPPLFENNATIADFDSRGFNLGPHLFTRDGNRNVDPMYLQNLRRNQFDGPTIGRQGIGNSCSDLVELERAYLEALLLSQKAQNGHQFHGRYGNMNKDCSYRNQRCGAGMSYPVIPNSPMGSFPHRYGERSINFPSALRKMPGGMMGSWHPEIDGNMHESFMSSSLLDEFKSNKTRCFELSEIVGHIVEFSADQYGSRFIQQKLETATPDEINLVYDEIRPQAISLMTDVFGNYVVQKFFEHGTPSQIRELANQLIGNVLNFSLQMYGCRVIQKAIEVVELDLQKEMVAELDGHIMRCIRDQNGNHVIQKCIECIPEDAIQFVIMVFYDQVVTLSSHPYGCRVIQRVLEHCHDPETQSKVMDEIMKSVCSLTQDQYGNYVVQHVLEHGKPEERSAIINKLVGQIVHLSQQKFASNVIEKCLTFGSPTERQTLVNELLGSTNENDPLQVMMKDQFANYVVQKVLETCDDQQLESILNRIKDHLNTLKKYTYGKHIVARVEKLVVAGERRISGLMLAKSALDGIEKEV